MSNERFTIEWWRELFKKGNPLGYGAVELRDEDKYYWILRGRKGSMELTRAVAERFGEEGAKLIAELRERQMQERWEFLLNCLDVKPTDPTGVAAVAASSEAQLGADVEMNVSPDGATAEVIVRRCTELELGQISKDRCRTGAATEMKAFLKALGPSAENVELAETEIDPPRHCRIVFRWKK